MLVPRFFFRGFATPVETLNIFSQSPSPPAATKRATPSRPLAPLMVNGCRPSYASYAAWELWAWAHGPTPYAPAQVKTADINARFSPSPRDRSPSLLSLGFPCFTTDRGPAYKLHVMLCGWQQVSNCVREDGKKCNNTG